MSETRKRRRAAARKKRTATSRLRTEPRLESAEPTPSSKRREPAGWGAPPTEWTESFPFTICDLYQAHYWLSNFGFDMADLFVTHRNVVTKLAKPMLGSGAGGYVEEVRPHVCTELRLEGHPPFVIPCTPSPFDDYEKSQSEWFETVVVPGWNRLSNEKAAHAHEELDRIVERGSVIPRRRITELMASLMLRGIPLPNDGGEPLAERAVRAFRTRVSAEKN